MKTRVGPPVPRDIERNRGRVGLGGVASDRGVLPGFLELPVEPAGRHLPVVVVEAQPPVGGVLADVEHPMLNMGRDDRQFADGGALLRGFYLTRLGEDGDPSDLPNGHPFRKSQDPVAPEEFALACALVLFDGVDVEQDPLDRELELEREGDPVDLDCLVGPVVLGHHLRQLVEFKDRTGDVLSDAHVAFPLVGQGWELTSKPNLSITII